MLKSSRNSPLSLVFPWTQGMNQKLVCFIAYASVLSPGRTLYDISSRVVKFDGTLLHISSVDIALPA